MIDFTDDLDLEIVRILGHGCGDGRAPPERDERRTIPDDDPCQGGSPEEE